MGREGLRRVVLVVLSGLAALLLAEFLTRWLVTVREVGPVFTIHDPTLGKRLKPNLSAERITPEFRMRISTNASGFRGPELSLPARTRPILFLGDSFTLGYGVDDGEEYPARVAALLRQRYGDASPPALNAGIGNSGNGFWLKFLRTQGAAIDPRVVVMQLFANDFEDNVREGLFAVAPDGSLVELAVPPPGNMRRLQSVIEALPGASQSYLVGLVRQVLTEGGGSPTPAAETQGVAGETEERVTLAILEVVLKACQARGWPVVGLLVGLPAARENAVLAAFARYGGKTIKIPSKIERPDLYYRIDGHWHARGHAFVAQSVLDALLPLIGPAP